MNDHKISVTILTVEQTDAVLEQVCKELNVPEDLVYCFSVFLIRRDEDGDITIVRKLQDLDTAGSWDCSLDDRLLAEQPTLNLLFIQTVVDMERCCPARWGGGEGGCRSCGEEVGKGRRQEYRTVRQVGDPAVDSAVRDQEKEQEQKQEQEEKDEKKEQEEEEEMDEKKEQVEQEEHKPRPKDIYFFFFNFR